MASSSSSSATPIRIGKCHCIDTVSPIDPTIPSVLLPGTMKSAMQRDLVLIGTQALIRDLKVLAKLKGKAVPMCTLLVKPYPGGSHRMRSLLTRSRFSRGLDTMDNIKERKMLISATLRHLEFWSDRNKTDLVMYSAFINGKVMIVPFEPHLYCGLKVSLPIGCNIYYWSQTDNHHRQLEEFLAAITTASVPPSASSSSPWRKALVLSPPPKPFCTIHQCPGIDSDVKCGDCSKILCGTHRYGLVGSIPSNLWFCLPCITARDLAATVADPVVPPKKCHVDHCIIETNSECSDCSKVVCTAHRYVVISFDEDLDKFTTQAIRCFTCHAAQSRQDCYLPVDTTVISSSSSTSTIAALSLSSESKSRIAFNVNLQLLGEPMAGASAVAPPPKEKCHVDQCDSDTPTSPCHQCSKTVCMRHQCAVVDDTKKWGERATMICVACLDARKDKCGIYKCTAATNGIKCNGCHKTICDWHLETDLAYNNDLGRFVTRAVKCIMCNKSYFGAALSSGPSLATLVGAPPPPPVPASVVVAVEPEANVEPIKRSIPAETVAKQLAENNEWKSKGEELFERLMKWHVGPMMRFVVFSKEELMEIASKGSNPEDDYKEWQEQDRIRKTAKRSVPSPSTSTGGTPVPAEPESKVEPVKRSIPAETVEAIATEIQERKVITNTSTWKRPPLQEGKDAFVYCRAHGRITNMNYMGGPFLISEQPDCICCQGRHRGADYLERVNQTQEQYEKDHLVPKEQWLRVSYGNRTVLGEPYPRVEVGPPAS